MRRRLQSPSPALVISLIALFVALGGTAAAANGLISGKTIIDHSIAEKKLSSGAISALRATHGEKAYATASLDGVPVTDQYVTLASLALPGGGRWSYVVFATTMIQTSADPGARCYLARDSTTMDDVAVGGTNHGSGAVPLTLVGTVGPSANSMKVTLACGRYSQSDARAYGSRIVAIKVGSVTGPTDAP